MELSVLESLLEALAAQIPASGFRLDGIEVEVGALLDIDPAEVQQLLANALPGVEVRMVTGAALLRCTDCGAEYPPEEHPCPVCGSPRSTVLHGQELGIARAWGETV